MDVSLLCAIARVSRSGYYKWLPRADDPEWDHNDYLLVKESFDKGKGKWGFRSVQMNLLEKGTVMNHKKISRIMRKYCLMATIRRTNPYKAIMKKSLAHRTFDNILNRQFTQLVPFRAYCTDITYLPWLGRFAYLSIIKDIASGEVTAWNLSLHPDMDLVIGTIKRLKMNPSIPCFADAMIHSDQGFHYTNPVYIDLVKDMRMIQSMSRKGNCIDNAPVESFFGHFKDDVDYRSCKSFEELYALIEEYVRYYNNERRQWDLKKMTPVAYRNHLLETVG